MAESAPQSKPESSAGQLQRELPELRSALGRGECQRVLQRADELLAGAPTHRDLLYLKAVSLRFLQRSRDALRVLDELQRLHPGYARQYQERGYCERSLGHGAAALRAFGQATDLNGTLVGSWTAAAELLQRDGDTRQAQRLLQVASQVRALPPPVLSASDRFAEGDIDGAETEIRRFLLQHGDHVEGMRLLARIGIHHEVFDDAELLLRTVLERSPDYTAARHDYATVLVQQQRHQEALAHIGQLLEAEPDNVSFLTLKASALAGNGDQLAAFELYRRLLPLSPQPSDIWLSMGHALKTMGRQAEAIAAYRKSAELRPANGDAWWSLANLKTYRFDAGAIARMQCLEADPAAGDADRTALCFALGKALEDQGAYAESFACYERGNALRRASSRHSAEAFEQTFAQQRAVCTAELFAARQGWGCPSRAPIFIVGLPRAGSTLLEQILASHSQVEGTMELPGVPRLAQLLSGREMTYTRGAAQRYPRILAELDAEQCAAFGERFLRESLPYRSGRPRFIDKMPNNFRHLGLIHLMLPNARVIDARREPMACCFSNFKQLFATGQEFSYGLTDIGRYYRAYVGLMAHWEAVLPGKVLRVQHEQVVDDLEGSVRRMLEFLELDFEPACLRFHRTERNVRTASSEQVRRPISREGLDQWRHFEAFLEPLRAALGDCGLNF